MATITATATPVIKYSDTTDITLLLPADIAKFTEKDFALFTPQQQSDLSAAQVAPLTAKQVSTLPLKLVEPDTIAAMTTAAVASFDLKTFTTDQFAALTSLQFKALTSTQISALTALQVDALTPDQASVFTSSQIAALAPKLVSVLNGSIIERLPAAAIAGFNAKNIIGLTTDSIAAITTDQAAVLTSSQIAALPSKIIAELPVDDIAVLTPAAIKGFTKANIGALDLTTLSSDQFSALTPTQTGLLSPAQLGALTVDFAPFLTSKAISLLTPVQLGSLATDVISALDSLTVKGLTVKNITGLTADQIGALTSDQTGNLSKVQLSTFTTGQISNLSPESVLAIKPAIFKALNSDLLSHLDPTAFSSLTDVQLGSLTAGQVAGLSVDQINKFSGSQIALIKPAALANLTTGTISSLSDDAVASLTDKQLARFTTAADGQLAHFTPAQMTKFSTDAKTWLTTSKGFATIESTAKTGSGVNTTKTIVGAAAAETITSGGGNDIITTVGGLADKIISGAGSDTISITGDIHSVDAGDGVDTLNITSFSGNFSKISGVEVVKLAVASAGQTLALSGITNAFATVNADILADGQSLGLTGSYNVDKVAVSLIAGDVDANSSSTSFNVTATTGSNIIKTGSGADSILAGAGSDSIEAGSGNDTINGEADNDTIDGGANVDSMTGGAGNDTFVFNTTSNGATSAAALSTNFDTITDYTTGSDVIDFVNPLSIHATTAAPTNDALAKISATGLATFTPATTTMVGRITAVEAATNHVANSSAIFTDVTGTDAYVFISDGASGVGTGDVLIKLAGNGAAAKSLSISSTGDVTSISAYTAATFVSGISGSTIYDSDAVYIVDGGTAISTAIADASLLGASPYANKTKIDVIDASDTVAIAMTAAQEQAITAAKLATDDTINIVDTATNIQNNWAALITDSAKIDLIDSSTQVISLTYDQATTLNSAGVKFAATNAITITGITDAQAVAASALTTTTLGGLSITLTGDGAISTLTQASVAAQNASTKWAGTEALTVTATDSTGEHTISGLLKSVIGGSGITLKGTDAATSITYAEAVAQHTDTKWSTLDAVTVTGIDTNTKAAVASTFNTVTLANTKNLGGSGITLDTASAAVSLENTVAIAQPTGTKWSSTTAVTITGTVASSAVAQAKYVAGTFGGSTVTIEATTSITAAALTTAIANSQKFSGALTVTDIASVDETAALTAFTKATTSASSVRLTATDAHWDVAATALTTALGAANAVKFASSDTLTVTTITGDTNSTAESLALITAFTPTTTGASSVRLDSFDNAWTVAYSDLPTVAKFDDGDAVVVTGVTVTNAADAAVKNISTIGGSGITLDASGAAISITNAVVQPTTTKWKSDSALTITAIASGDEGTALTANTTAIKGGSSVTLVAADNTWSVAASDLAGALGAGEKLAGALTVTAIASGADETAAYSGATAFTTTRTGATSVLLTAADTTWDVADTALTTALAAGEKFANTLTVTVASGSNAADLAAFTIASTGATDLVLDSAAGTNAWAIAYSALPTGNVKFGADDVVTITVPNANESAASALSTSTKGGSSIVLDSSDNAVSLNATQATAQIATTNTKWKSTGDVVTVNTILTGAGQTTALSNYTLAALGGSKIILETNETAGWSLPDSSLKSALQTAYVSTAGTGANTNGKLAFITTGATDKVTVSGITIGRQASTLTEYTKTLLGAEAVVLDADSNAWSVAGSALTTALVTEGIKVASTDAVTVTAIDSSDQTKSEAALVAFTRATTGASKVTLDSAAAGNAWTVSGSALTAALTANISAASAAQPLFDATDALTVIVSSAGESTTTFTKATTGASGLVLDAVDNSWSVAYGALDTALSTTVGIKFGATDTVTVTGIDTTTSVKQAAALAAYTPTTTGATAVVLDADTTNGGNAWNMSESALALKAGTVTFANSDTLTVADISSVREATVITANHSIYLPAKPNANNIGATTVVLDAADNTWTLAAADASGAISDGVKFSTGDAITIADSGANLAALTFADINTTKLGGSSIVLSSTSAPATTTLTVVQAQAAIDGSVGFSGGTVAITMTTAGDTIDISVTNKTLGTAEKDFVYGAADKAGGLTFVDVATNTALADTDYFRTANIDVITGFITAANAATNFDKLVLTAFKTGGTTALAAATGTAGATTDLTTTGSLMKDGTYDIIVGTYDTVSGNFVADTTPTAAGNAVVATLVAWDGNTTANVTGPPAVTNVDMVGVVLIGVTDLAVGDLTL